MQASCTRLRRLSWRATSRANVRDKPSYSYRQNICRRISPKHMSFWKKIVFMGCILLWAYLCHAEKLPSKNWIFGIPMDQAFQGVTSISPSGQRYVGHKSGPVTTERFLNKPIFTPFWNTSCCGEGQFSQHCLGVGPWELHF